MEKVEKKPLITLKSFLISAAIIFGLFIIVSLVLDEPKKKENEKRASINGNEYEYTVVDGNEFSDNSILIIPVSGVILTEGSSDTGFFNFLSEEGVTYGYDIKDQFKKAAKEKDIKGIILAINSPGGTIPGAKAIADGVAYYRAKTGKPVYAHITDMGASGGYWAAASTDYIVSEIGSEIGSIGVIMGPFKYYDNVTGESSFLGGVDTEGGIESRYFSAGQFKDTGSPYRRLSDEEVKHWQTSLDNEYDRFVTFVSIRRNIEPSTIRTTIKALPYETKRALELGLIDEEGSRDDTITMIAATAGLKDYKVVQENPVFGFFDNLFGAASRLLPEKTAKSCSWCHGPLLLYDRSYSLQ